MRKADYERAVARFLAALERRFLPAPMREYRFHPSREWRLDFAWPGRRLALEVEGGAFMKGGGRHTRGAGFRDDLEKYNAALVCGWRILRAMPEQVQTEALANLIQAALEAPR